MVAIRYRADFGFYHDRHKKREGYILKASDDMDRKRIDIMLRPITTADIDFMVRLSTDRAVTEYLPAMITNAAMMESWISDLGPSDHEYIVMLGDKEIGECSLTVAGDTAEIGFMLMPRYWRQGYGTGIVHRLLKIAEPMQIHELTATTDVRNDAAIALLAKTGFQSQKTGWMVILPTDEENATVGAGQDIVQFTRVI